MAVRKIVKIDEDKCNGCGLCVDACAEAAIEIVDGKAKLVGDLYCDGLGACLGKCPEDAIIIEEREADAFDLHAAHERMKRVGGPPSGCPSAAVVDLGRKPASACPSAALRQASDGDGALRNWPIQLALVPAHAPFLQGADIVLAADCTAFARPDVVRELAPGSPVIIACPKLDDAAAYVDKLSDVLNQARPSSVTIVHMSVPCCHGLAGIVKQALAGSGADTSVREVTVGIEGDIVAQEEWPKS